MNAAELLRHLRTLQVEVALDGDRLRVNAPAGALTADLQEKLRSRKEELVAFLSRAGELSVRKGSMVPLREGKKPPLFCVPGHNGDVFCFVPLAKALGGEHGLVAFQPPGVDGKEEPLTRVEDLAERFVSELRASQPAGPYRIGGYCTGGLVAFEAARQLRAGGHEVAELVLFGTPHPSTYGVLHQLSTPPVRAVNRLARFVRERAQPVVLPESPAEAVSPAGDQALAARRVKVENATLSAVRAYSLSKAPGRIVLFIPSENPRAMYCERYRDWEAVCDDFEMHAGPPECIHSRMLREPFVELLAQRLETVLVRDGD